MHFVQKFYISFVPVVSNKNDSSSSTRLSLPSDKSFRNWRANCARLLIASTHVVRTCSRLYLLNSIKNRVIINYSPRRMANAAKRFGLNHVSIISMPGENRVNLRVGRGRKKQRWNEGKHHVRVRVRNVHACMRNDDRRRPEQPGHAMGEMCFSLPPSLP